MKPTHILPIPCTNLSLDRGNARLEELNDTLEPIKKEIRPPIRPGLNRCTAAPEAASVTGCSKPTR